VSGGTDASGNPILADIGTLLVKRVSVRAFSKEIGCKLLWPLEPEIVQKRTFSNGQKEKYVKGKSVTFLILMLGFSPNFFC